MVGLFGCEGLPVASGKVVGLLTRVGFRELLQFTVENSKDFA